MWFLTHASSAPMHTTHKHTLVNYQSIDVPRRRGQVKSGARVRSTHTREHYNTSLNGRITTTTTTDDVAVDIERHCISLPPHPQFQSKPDVQVAQQFRASQCSSRMHLSVSHTRHVLSAVVLRLCSSTRLLYIANACQKLSAVLFCAIK